MDEERQMILRMLKEGKISVEEADALLRALEEDGETARSEPVEETRPGGTTSFAEFGAELGSAIREIVNTIPKEVLKEVRPHFFSVLHSLRDLAEGAAEETAEISMTAGDRLEIRNAWGDIRFAGSTDDQLHLTLRTRVWSASAEDAMQFARSLRIAPERSGRTVTISVPRVEGRRLRVDMQLMVPAGVEVTTVIAKGDIRAEGLRGSTQLRVARGDLAVSDHQGDVRMDVASGDISVQLKDLSDRAEVHLETVSGSIELSVPTRARASIDASVRTGRISSTLPLSQMSSDRRSLRGILNEPGAKVVLRTVSGDIEIAGHEA